MIYYIVFPLCIHCMDLTFHQPFDLCKFDNIMQSTKYMYGQLKLHEQSIGVLINLHKSMF